MTINKDSKPYNSCKRCGGELIKKGVRKSKFGETQKLVCKECGAHHSTKTVGFKNKTYSAKTIIAAITYYNLGHTIEQTSKQVNRRFKTKT